MDVGMNVFLMISVGISPSPEFTLDVTFYDDTLFCLQVHSLLRVISLTDCNKLLEHKSQVALILIFYTMYFTKLQSGTSDDIW